MKNPKTRGGPALVLWAICERVGTSSGKAWPSIALLAKNTGLSQRYVSTTIQLLEQAGYLIRHSGNSNRSNLYQLPSHIPGEDDAEGTDPQIGTELQISTIQAKQPEDGIDPEIGTDLQIGTDPQIRGGTDIQIREVLISGSGGYRSTDQTNLPIEPTHRTYTVEPIHHTPSVNATGDLSAAAPLARQSGREEQTGAASRAVTGNAIAREDRRSVTPAGLAAIALRRAGVRVSSHNPSLVTACTEGVTAEHMVELASAYPGKGAGYIIAIARRENAELKVEPSDMAHRTPGRRPTSAAARTRALALEAELRDSERRGAAFAADEIHQPEGWGFEDDGSPTGSTADAPSNKRNHRDRQAEADPTGNGRVIAAEFRAASDGRLPRETNADAINEAALRRLGLKE